MSFSNTKTPIKPTGKAKWQIPMRPNAKQPHLMEYFLEGKLKDKFCKLFPKHSNRRMMLWFGISHSTVQKFKREYNLEKDMNAIRKELAKDVKKICEKNGYYESLRGKAPSDAAIEATKKMWAEGFHPMKALKAKHPRRYRKVCQRKSEERKAMMEREKKHVRWGLSQETKLHLPCYIFTRTQVCHRYNALKRGYILGDRGEYSGERYTMFYDDATERSPIFERNCIADGFSIRKLD